MEFITNFADEAVLLPLIATIAACLAASGWWRGFLAWSMTVPGILGLMAILKYVFFACSGVLGATGVQNPSGHTAAGSAVYGSALALAVLHRMSPGWQAMPPVMLAAVFGFSRVALGAHTLPDVVAGGIVGVAGAMLTTRLAGPRPPMRVAPCLIGALAAIALFHGSRLQAEEAIHRSLFLALLPIPTACGKPVPVP